MSEEHVHDLIVVGLGAMGSAVAYHGSRRGLDVLGIDQYDPPHAMGSSHADSRITRLAVGEGPQYLPFVRRSHEVWRELEAMTGEELMVECGGYIVTEQEPVPGQRWEDFVTETARIAAGAGIDYTVLEPAHVRCRHPFVKLPDDRKVGYEPTAGLLIVDRCIEVQLRLARSQGAKLRPNTQVTDVVPNGQVVDVVTHDGSVHRASHVVLATGPWFAELAAPEHAEQVRVTRQVVFWFEPEDPARFSTDEMPFVMWIAHSDEDYVCIFPTPPGFGPGVKVLGEQFLEDTDARSVERTVGQAEIDEFYDTHLSTKLDGLTRNCLKAEVCLYTNTPDDHFLIDVDPRSNRIMAMSPCSGHGFKHSTALGEAVVDKLVRGRSVLDLTPFCG